MNIFRLALLSIGLSLSFLSLTAQADRVKDLAEVAGVRDNQLIGYGLVVGLNGTGDGKMSFTSQSMTSMLARFGVNLSDMLSNYDGSSTRNALELKNVAAVMLTADLELLPNRANVWTSLYPPLAPPVACAVAPC